MRIGGWLALFDVADANGDVLRRGAFAGAAVPLPLLAEHDPLRRIGTVVLLREAARGLWMEAELGPRGAAMARRVDGLSFGYRAGVEGTNRELLAVSLVEASLVARPMQAGARVIFREGEDNG